LTTPCGCATKPVMVSGLSGATAIAAGAMHSCAVAGGGVKCWGNDQDYQLGSGFSFPSTCPSGAYCAFTPVAVCSDSSCTGNLAGARAVVAGYSFTCALLSGGTVDCWGNGQDGQLGNGTTTAQAATPVAVSGLSGATALTAGDYHVCALQSAGAVQCWGLSASGQLGNGTSTGPFNCSGTFCAETPVAVTW
jgi:alpha-tubulin suppressor-like RCC1 family protein